MLQIIRALKTLLPFPQAFLSCLTKEKRLPYFYTMFTREQSSRTREEFWATFGRYMSPVTSAEGMKINWINYRTTIKDVYFRMSVRQKSALISISLEHSDTGMQALYFEHFLELKTLLHEALKEEWDWQLHVTVAENKVISRIYKEIAGVSAFNKDHWPDLISFFKPRIIALDSFWETAKYSFESLK